MEIEPTDWQRVVEAFERGKRAEQGKLKRGETLQSDWSNDYPFATGIDESRVRRELRQLKSRLAKCDPETLVEIDLCLPIGSTVLEAIDEAIDSMDEPLRKGRRKPYAYQEAVAVMTELWPGKKNRGARYDAAGQPHFNPFVRWLGCNLKRLDPKRLRADEVACLAAWNAFGAGLARPNKQP